MINNLSKFFFNKGLKLARANDLSAAIDVLAISIGFDNNNQDAYKLAGLCYYELGQLKMAEYCLKGFPVYLFELKKASDKYNQFINEFELPFNKNQIKKTLNYFINKEALSVNDLNCMGCLHMLLNKNKEAVGCFFKALQKDKSNTVTLACLSEMTLPCEGTFQRILKWVSLKGVKK